MRSYSRMVFNNAWRNLDLPWIQNSSRWRRVELGWIQDGSNWRPLWDLIDLPVTAPDGVFVSGRWGRIPGTIWGSTTTYSYWNIPTVKRVVGIQIQINVGKEQGSFHGNGGRFGAGRTSPAITWEAGPWTGLQTSPYMACNFAAGEEIRVWCYGNDDDGDGKTIDFVKLVNVYYE